MGKKVFLLCSALLLSSLAGQARAALVNWTIDANQSWIRLNVADQMIDIGGGNLLPTALRDQGAAPNSPVAGSWTDAGKRLAGVTGTLSTNMTANSITFNGGSHAAPATASGQWRPDGPSWNGSTFNTASGATTPSVFAADLTVQGLLRVAFLNFYNVNTDYSGTATGLVNYAGTGSGNLSMGSQGATLDLDALQIIGDSRTPNLGVMMAAGVLGGNSSLNITNTGGLNREMDLQFNLVPENQKLKFNVLINGLPVQASFDMRIVATATVPEPTSAALVGFGIALCGLRRRRSA